MSVKPEPLSIRNYLIGFLVLLPLTVGPAYLCGHIDGVEKSGWIGGLSFLAFSFFLFTIFESFKIPDNKNLLFFILGGIVVYMFQKRNR
jgi:hypothetical protein